MLATTPKAYAQEEEEPVAERWTEVVVSAQRVEESSQEVPIAVTALTGDMLRRQSDRRPVGFCR